MRRALAAAAVLVALLGTAFTDTASAATAGRAPKVTCNDWKVWPPWGSSCWCPPGWHVKWPPLYEFWEPLVCVRNKK